MCGHCSENAARRLPPLPGMSSAEDATAKDCIRCGGRALYSVSAVVPGDPMAPSRSRRAIAHEQPAWTCLSCGHLEPHERRSPSRIAKLAVAAEDKPCSEFSRDA